MAPTAKKTKQIHTTVPVEFANALAERKWDARKEPVEIVRDAVYEKAQREGWMPELPVEEADAPAEEPVKTEAPAKASKTS